MRSIVALITGLAVSLPLIVAECPNACSAHGKCGAYDMCSCFRNWMANDCSERVCQFGLAHVDTPKGDLDSSSGKLSGPSTVVVQNDAVWPFGTTEQYPATVDLNGNVLTNTAHEYRECSNKGLCDRATGNCACFEGYEGSACQRASCPTNADGMCSGHGTCETIKEIAARDYNNGYHLWDEHSTMGCVCDPGYSGSDCSERVCKWGADPLYYDDKQNIRYSNWTYQFYTTNQNQQLTGNYSLVFYDAHGEDWQTAPLDWNATCETVTAALEDLPNNVIPVGSVLCYKGEFTQSGSGPGQSSSEDPIYDTNMFVHSKYTIAFPSNPGKLKQIEINKYLDGSRPTLYSDETTSTLGWHIYANGFTGENTDYVPDLCEGVKVTLNIEAGQYTHYLGGLTTAEEKLLKVCLGDANGKADDNVADDVYDWDYGDQYNPHLIKLIDATQDTSISTTDRFGDTDQDLALSRYPVSKLCSKSDGSAYAVSAAYPQVDQYGIYVCPNRNPPGFYAVVYYDPTLHASKPWRVYTRAAKDYADTTEFYVYTTTGYLQMVNPNAAVFTNGYNWANSLKATRHYSRTVRAANTTNNWANFFGAMDCETNPIGSNGALDCLHKNDHVMLLSTLGSTQTSNKYLVPTASYKWEAEDLAANPVYPNIFQLKKITRNQEDPDVLPAHQGLAGELNRHELTFDVSLNSQFLFRQGPNTAGDSTAQVFKFYPPVESKRYNWAGECSKRGLCNTKTGTCQCFPGFSSDDCSKVNALSN